ncbi:hypothetical protein EDM57_04705 [Brevibacillus gelatini]|uniref:Uncharacterized protein n=1 Tax=Brevibacillus gelatini TaxID=1655277 RepID=A0A3M8B7N2_9BACL|nr:hypothetical protein [Brevibacillus gelatini]RNB59446.1 hypothetical protein EDM57_04705 [Brevibacillus gelatini]
MSKQTVINPIEYISSILESNGYGKNLVLGHIKYDQAVNEDYDYQVIRSSSHDGTILFTMMLVDEALNPIINKTTYCTKTITEEELKKLVDIEYIIGDIKMETEIGVQDLPAGRYMGQTDTVYIPVRCRYIF